MRAGVPSKEKRPFVAGQTRTRVVSTRNSGKDKKPPHKLAQVSRLMSRFKISLLCAATKNLVSKPASERKANPRGNSARQNYRPGQATAASLGNSVKSGCVSFSRFPLSLVSFSGEQKWRTKRGNMQPQKICGG